MNLLAIITHGAVGYGSGYAVAQHPDLRTSLLRKEGATVKLWQDTRVLGGLLGAVASVVSPTTAVGAIGSELAIAAANTVATTEAIRNVAIAKAAKEVAVPGAGE